jgi:hypothetical protein
LDSSSLRTLATALPVRGSGAAAWLGTAGRAPGRFLSLLIRNIRISFQPSPNGGDRLIANTAPAPVLAAGRKVRNFRTFLQTVAVCRTSGKMAPSLAVVVIIATTASERALTC